MTKHTITESIASREALNAFADLTRHKPNLLADKFSCTLAVEGEEATIELAFAGKRKASKTFAAAMLDLSLNDFATQILKPLAKELLGSA